MEKQRKSLFKKFITGVLPIVLCMALVIPVFSLYTTVRPAGFEELPKSDYYGRNALSKLSNGKKYVTAYDRMVEGIANLQTEVNVSDLGLKKDVILGIWRAVNGDPIDDFWLGPEPQLTSYYVNSQTGVVTRVCFQYYGDIKGNLSSKKKLYNSSLQKFVNGLNITPGMSEAQIVFEIHNKLALQITYTNDQKYHVDNDFGSIVEGMAECDGYAHAFTNILAMYGIQAFSVSGIMKEDSVGHAWNIIRIDGKYYQCDLTWNDSDTGNDERGIYYHKYNITSKEMLSDRSYRSAYIFSLPNCTATAANYYASHPEMCLSTKSPLESFAALEKDGFICVHISDTQNFKSWIETNIDALVDLCGYDRLKEYSYDYDYRSNEYHIFITGSRIDESEKIPGDKNRDGIITYEEFYGRCSLAASADRVKLLTAYDRIYNGVAALEAKIDLSDLELTTEQYRRVFYAYRGDPTGHFWLDEVNCKSYVFTQSQLMARVDCAYFEDLTSSLDEAKRLYSREMTDFIKNLNLSKNASQYDITLAVHDGLAMKATEYDSAKTHSPYYLMTENIGRCHAYCHAYTEILANLGVSAFTMYGKKYDEKSDSYYRHSWNLTCVDGTYCYTDVCCDDKTLSGEKADSKDIYYNFFNVDAEQLFVAHDPEEHYPYALPENISNKMSYFERKSYLYVNSSTPYAIYDLVEKDGFIRVKYAPEVGEDRESFEMIFVDMQKEIAKACGYVAVPDDPIRFEQYCGEYHIYIEGLKRNEAPQKGDVYRDNSITPLDANFLLRVITETIDPDYVMKYACDMNGDEIISGMDSNLLKRRLVSN